MITQETLMIFEKYRRDHYMWARIGNAREAKNKTSSDWDLIDSTLCLDIHPSHKTASFRSDSSSLLV